MNFLAHLLTGDSGEAMMVGSFAGDFCRGRLEKHPVRLRAGIRLHRMVDAFAEDHRSFSAVRALLRPSLGLYSAVGADMLIDHLLARHWDRWLPAESLPAFADRVGAVLVEHSHWLPEKGRKIARMMILGRWLESYAREDGIRTALEKMSMRTRGNIRLSDAMDELDRSRSQVSAAAHDFLGDLFSSATLIDAGMRGNLSSVMR